MSDSILFPSWTSYNSATLLMRNMLGSTGFVIIIHIFSKVTVCNKTYGFYIWSRRQETEVLAFRGRNIH
jgi:hypothetical protein